MKGSLHSLLLPSPTKSLRYHEWNNMKTQSNSLLEFGRGLKHRLWGAGSWGTLLFSRRLHGRSTGKLWGKNDLAQMSQLLPTTLVPKLQGAASEPCCSQTLFQFSPRSTLLPALRYLPDKTQPYRSSFTSRLRTCLGPSAARFPAGGCCHALLAPF